MPSLYIVVGVDRVKGDEGGGASLPLFLSISRLGQVPCGRRARAIYLAYASP
jgi:hypothetical protein